MEIQKIIEGAIDDIFDDLDLAPRVKKREEPRDEPRRRGVGGSALPTPDDVIEQINIIRSSLSLTHSDNYDRVTDYLKNLSTADMRELYKRMSDIAGIVETGLDVAGQTTPNANRTERRDSRATWEEPLV